MDPFTAFLIEEGSRIAIIIALLVFGKALMRLIVGRMKRMASDRNEDSRSDLGKRAETLSGVITTTGDIVIYSIALLMLLELIGLDIRPILAGAGIVGLAVGFGAQSLVKDFVSGLFILIENQYSVGDKVRIGTAEGEVVRVSIRSTVLRNTDGQYVYLSNGNIATRDVENLSQTDLSEGYGSKSK